MELGSAFAAILIIVALEAVLSVDNAMVLAVMVRPLPEHLRSRALLYGIIGAYVLRGLALLFATIIIQIWWIQLLGGLYLVYLAANHLFWSKPGEAAESERARLQQAAAASFWRIVLMINVVDLAFAVDSVLVVIAFSREFWVIFTGVAIGILLIRLAAGIMVTIIERYPRLESVAYAVVGWAGLKLMLEGWGHGSEVWLHRPELALHLPQAFFLSVTFAILVLGSLWAFRRPT
ncbi:MAG: membrane protein [Meiothermus sp.]|nr:MAG: membrane protein [Meiothermus sp.]